jgi:hypothetical protein
LGGYVKIAGMVDESMDKEQLKQPAQPWEFRSKPAWQRLIIMIGGVTVNVLLAFFIYAMILFKWGETKLPMSSLNNGIWIVDTVINEIGLHNGDKIVSVNDEKVAYFDNINSSLMLGDHMDIMRDGQPMRLAIPVNIIEKIVEKACHNPAILFEIDRRGFIKEGFYADLVLVDLNQKYTVSKGNILYKCGWSPFEGAQFDSVVTHTLVNGNVVYQAGKFDETAKGMRLTFNR